MNQTSGIQGTGLTCDEASASHTPGKWEAGYGGGVCGPRGCFMPYLPDRKFLTVPIRVDNQPVAWIIVDGGTRDLRVAADARLIAAAPELLALAKEYASSCINCNGLGYTVGEDGVTVCGPDDRESTREHCSECEHIRALVAKAEGSK